MQVSKLKLKNVITIVICLVGVAVLSSCSKEKTVNSGDFIVGKWVTSDYNSNHSDTIYFTSGMRVENYFIFAHTTMYPTSSYYFTYSSIGNSIKITSYRPESAAYSETFAYILNGNFLMIKGFSNPFSLTNEVRTDVHFTRVE